MAQVIIPYEDSAGTKYGASVELASESVLNDYCAQLATPFVRTAPYGSAFATLEALQAQTGWGGAIAIPSGIQTRSLSFSATDNTTSDPLSGGPADYAAIASFNSVVGDLATFDALFPTGASPLPGSFVQLGNIQSYLTGANGESRSSN